VVTEELRQSVGAHYGLRDWLAQRATAVVITLYTLLLLAILLWHGGFDYATWRALFQSGLFATTTFVFLVAVFIHAWVGVRNILMDYIKPVGLRITLEVTVVCVLVAYSGWAIQVLWGMR
jgi:succinate dehydrogenase / fumarate reductase, membrane anchor subunit